MDATNGTDVERQCPWCGAEASAESKTCAECGANLIQRETIGDLVIPGVTHVDPALEQYAADPLRIPKASPSQYVAGPAIGAVAAAGPAGLLALGGLAAVGATEYLTAGSGAVSRQLDPERVGEPSETVLQMIRKLEEDGEPAPNASKADETTAEDTSTSL